MPLKNRWARASRLAQESVVATNREESKRSMQDQVERDGMSNEFGRMHDASQLRYYLVIDFEATCWKEGQSSSDQEIIEFPAVLLHATSLETIAEFREFVRPTEYPRLSAFCSQFTGIQQRDVDAAETLFEVLLRFGAWLDGFGLNDDPSAALPVTCGDYDLGSVLPKESRRKGVTYHPTLSWWCNIKKPFSTATQSKARGMDGMLQYLGLPLVGHHHSGIDDARNISCILRELLCTRGAKVSYTSGHPPLPKAPSKAPQGAAHQSSGYPGGVPLLPNNDSFQFHEERPNTKRPNLGSKTANDERKPVRRYPATAAR